MGVELMDQSKLQESYSAEADLPTSRVQSMLVIIGAARTVTTLLES